MEERLSSEETSDILNLLQEISEELQIILLITKFPSSSVTLMTKNITPYEQLCCIESLLSLLYERAVTTNPNDPHIGKWKTLLRSIKELIHSIKNYDSEEEIPN